ncbi:MAG: 16S rRNA (uracil(1498)-N(3))-methyltransferase [Actinomycetota bacterium]
MTFPHFFAPSVEDDIVRIEGEEARHALRVLRIKPGERVTVSDGRGTVVEGVVEPDARALVVRVAARERSSSPPPRLVVYPAVPKKGKLEVIVQKLTELGVEEIRPWFAERSVPRWDPSKSASYAERLRAVALEAAKQSRRPFLPEVFEPGRLGDLPEVTVVLDAGAPESLNAALAGKTPAELGLVVGPEGGLSPEELAELQALGSRVATIGPTILRAETAAIVGATLVLARYSRIG